HTPRPESVVRGRQISAGPVLPTGRLHHPVTAPARAGRRLAAPGAALRAALQPRTGARGTPGGPGGTGAPAELLLAGQHSGAAERPEAGLAPGQRRGSSPGLPA